MVSGTVVAIKMRVNGEQSTKRRGALSEAENGAHVHEFHDSVTDRVMLADFGSTAVAMDLLDAAVACRT